MVVYRVIRYASFKKWSNIGPSPVAPHTIWLDNSKSPFVNLLLLNFGGLFAVVDVLGEEVDHLVALEQDVVEARAREIQILKLPLRISQGGLLKPSKFMAIFYLKLKLWMVIFSSTTKHLQIGSSDLVWPRKALFVIAGPSASFWYIISLKCLYFNPEFSRLRVMWPRVTSGTTFS